MCECVFVSVFVSVSVSVCVCVCVPQHHWCLGWTLISPAAPHQHSAKHTQFSSDQINQSISQSLATLKCD